MSHAFVLILALLLDAAMGEPNWIWSRFPHPVVVMGRAVGWLDRQLNIGPDQKRNGVIAIIALILGAGFLGVALSQLGPLAEIIIAAILLAAASIALTADAADPYLVKDINLVVENDESDPRNFVGMGGVTYFAADDGIHGYALWRTDGTALGTEFVTDPVPEPTPFVPWLVVANQTLFLGYVEGVWSSDGTAAGTRRVTPHAGFPVLNAEFPQALHRDLSALLDLVLDQGRQLKQEVLDVFLVHPRPVGEVVDQLGSRHA